MRPPEAESVSMVICEDIRVEASRRLSLMGVFGPSIEVETLPTLLPGLCAVLIVRDPHESLTEVTTALLDASNNPILPANSQTVSPPGGAMKFAYQFQVKLVPFPLAAEGDITFRFTFNRGGDIGVALPIKVRLKKA